jgi:transposase
MIHLGIDHHKAYSQVIAISDKGEILVEERLSCLPEVWIELKARLPQGEPIQSVLEAGWNWGKLYDMIEGLGFAPKLANPLKVRVIAESFIKTDKRDALALAQLLRMGWIPEVHVPSKAIRDQKNLLRQRAWLVGRKTSIKNRIHALLDRNHLEPVEVTDIFGTRGKAWMRALNLSGPDGLLLAADLEILESTQQHIKQTEKWIDQALVEHPDLELLLTLPGVGKLLGAMIALEIDGVERFSTPEKMAAYCGLVASTYQSSDTLHHGGMVPGCNRHLRYAFIEAAWTAVRVSPYFSAYYKRLKVKRGSQTAIGAAARKLCVITWHCLKAKHSYVEKPYRFRPGRLVCALA